MTVACTLVVDASTSAGSAVVVRGGEVLAAEAVAMRDPGGEWLMPAVAAVLARAGAAPASLERVACGAGPGSFTSLRIAAGIAKGLAAATGVPLVAVPSLLLAAADAAAADGAGALAVARPGRYVAVLDALRGECYAAAFELERGGRATPLPLPPLLPLGEVERAARAMGAVLVRTPPNARGAAALAAWLDEQPPVTLATWEPVYGRPAEAQARWEAAHGAPLPLA